MSLTEQDIAVGRLAVRFTIRLTQEFQDSGYPYPTPLTFAPSNRPDLLAEWEKSAGDAKTAIQAIISGSTGNVAQVEESKTWRTATDEEINDYMRRITHTPLHMSCTCPMSESEDSGVVD
ncbi:hypothetical protein F4825DRAFT_471498 [Nemania diffusa]|nr:hypothetical protein F4825DRAFT_471498 [Nemania diffusa]